MGRASNDRFLNRLDGRVGIGRAQSPDGPYCAVEIALARRATPTAAALLGTMPGSPSNGFIASLPDGERVRPTTMVVNQSEAPTPAMTDLFRGPVMYGVAEAIAADPDFDRLTDWLINEIVVRASVHVPAAVVFAPADTMHRLVRVATARALERAKESIPFHAVTPAYPG